MWHFILEAAGYDPLRAQEIEERVSQVWWDRWRVDREERIRAAPQGRGQGLPPAPTEPPGATRARYVLTADGRLVPAAPETPTA